MGQFKAEKTQAGADVVIKLQGPIDEDAQFAPLDLGGAAARVLLDLDGITAINSCGIREWIKWIRTAPPSATVVYQKCPKVIVDQINMVSGFLPEKGQVESFYVPYYSDASGSEKMVLFRQGHEIAGHELKPPAEVKDENGEAMEMDVIEAKYFKFLQKV